MFSMPLNSAIALHKEHLRLKGDPNMKKERLDLLRAVKASEQNALEISLTGWTALSHSRRGKLCLYEELQSIMDTLAPSDQTLL